MAIRSHTLLVSFSVCLAFAFGHVSALCTTPVGGFPIFQCANYSHVAPPPGVSVQLDPNGYATNVSSVFWQIGFGNRPIELMNSSSATGVSGAATFNGNDSGAAPIWMKDARQATLNFQIPANALCMIVTNWGNSGIDGCANNDRDPTMPYSADGFLNPVFDVYRAYNGYYGEYSLTGRQDYPMALLMKAPVQTFPCDHTPVCNASNMCASGPLAGSPCGSDFQCAGCSGGPRSGRWCSLDSQCVDDSRSRWFAFAAVAAFDRLNDGSGDNGPCSATSPGDNPGPCYLGGGFYDLKDLTNGQVNPATGRTDVIPWQEPPAPALTCVSGCAGTGARTVDMSWPAVTIYHDSSVRPSENPAMAPADPTRAPGVGVLDVASKFPLVRYQLEGAAATCANFDSNGVVRPETLTWSSFGAETPATSLSGVTVPAGTCLRTRVLFGKKPETAAISAANCRVGKCGDIGYDAVRDDPDAVRCVGGPIDTDGDGALNCGGLDCDDSDPGSFATPGLVNVENVVELPSGAVRYAWSDQSATAGTGTHYDVYSGSAYSLAGVGDFTHGSCFADNLTTPYMDVNPPGMQPNEYLYFLVRAQNGCATSTSGYGTGGRDSGAASSASPCN